MAITLINAGINVAAFIAGSRWGVVGIAAGGALSFVLICVPLTVARASRRGPVGALDFIADIWPQIVSGAITYAILIRVERLFDAGSIVGIVLFTASSYVIFSALVFLLPGGRMYINDAVRLARSQFVTSA
jgi:hypothetical protein